MNIDEYKKVEKMTYREYCDYLKQKYGTPKKPYMSEKWIKTAGTSLPTRTKEGLFIHHVYEDCAVLLARPEYAEKHPYEWQLPENLVYCDYLEHLLLHILICEYPSEKRCERESVGIGGIVTFIVPELNDYYGGYKPLDGNAWQYRCFEKVSDDKDVYFELLNKFSWIAREKYYGFWDDLEFRVSDLCKCSKYHQGWSDDKNKEIYSEITEQVFM